MIGFCFKLFFHVAATAAVFWALENYLLSDYFSITGENWWLAYGIVGFVFGMLNSLIKPILKVLLIPVEFLTLGLAGLVLNGAMLWITQEIVHLADFNSTQFTIENWWMYLVLGFILSIAHGIIHWFK